MRVITNNQAPVHSAHYPRTPSVTVLFAEDDSVDVGMVRVSVPAGVGMPVHRHGGSDVILTPVAGAVRITNDDNVADIAVGDTILILKDEAVALWNSRHSFQLLCGLRDHMRDTNPALVGDGKLSMGMSGDYELAFEEGATCVRVGQAIFGPRATPDSDYQPSGDGSDHTSATADHGDAE